MSAVDVIERARSSELVDEDDESVTLDLLPPLSSGEIDTLQAEVGVPLPDELKQLLGYCSGIDGCLDLIDFTGRNLSFEIAEVFPHGLPIAGDGFGSFWVLDLLPTRSETAPVFFACHDAPVILFQSANLSDFLHEVFRMFTADHASLVNDVHEDRIFEVWRKNPGVIEQSAACQSTDAALRAFAATLPAHFQIIDLRNAKPGMGFSWGRYGPRTEVRRQGSERIFAYAKPQQRGWLSRLFGR